MPKFFGRNVDYDGCEAVIKLGSKYSDINDPRHAKSLRDGHIIQVMPFGYHIGRRIGFSLALIQFPNISYCRIGGPSDINIGQLNSNTKKWKKIFTPRDIYGKYFWDYNSKQDKKANRNRQRDYFIDFYELFIKNYITQGEYENLYDFSHKSGPIVIPDSSFNELFHHEDGNHQRLNIEADTKHASVTNGTYDVGLGLDYDDGPTAKTDIGTPMDGSLTFEYANEETTESSEVLVDTQTNGHLLKFHAVSGAEHNGGAYGNGARIACASGVPAFNLDEITNGHLADVEISKLAVQGANNLRCVELTDCGYGGNILINRMRIDCSGTNCDGIWTGGTGVENIHIRNNIIDASDGEGILVNTADRTVSILNNTAASCLSGIRQDHPTTSTNLTCKNNIVQDCTNDYVDDGGGFGTTAKNFSEDATSPDVAYRNINCHDGNSCFLNFAGGDFRLDSGGDEISALESNSEDLTGIFTDDINGDTRTSASFICGADWIDLGGGGLSIPVAMLEHDHFNGGEIEEYGENG